MMRRKKRMRNDKDAAAISGGLLAMKHIAVIGASAGVGVLTHYLIEQALNLSMVNHYVSLGN
jgi:tRNA A58 N-methylase Trm61